MSAPMTKYLGYEEWVWYTGLCVVGLADLAIAIVLGSGALELSGFLLLLFAGIGVVYARSKMRRG